MKKRILSLFMVIAMTSTTMCGLLGINPKADAETDVTVYDVANGTDGWYVEGGGTIAGDPTNGLVFTVTADNARVRYDFNPIDATGKYIEMDMYIGDSAVANSMISPGFILCSGPAKWNPADFPNGYWDGVNWLEPYRNHGVYHVGWNHIAIPVPPKVGTAATDWDSAQLRSILLTFSTGAWSATSTCTFKNIKITSTVYKTNPINTSKTKVLSNCDTVSNGSVGITADGSHSADVLPTAGWGFNKSATEWNLTYMQISPDRTEGFGSLAANGLTGGVSLEYLAETPINVVGYQNLEFDMYIDNPAYMNSFPTKGVDISSAGTYTSNSQWTTSMPNFPLDNLQAGWNHIVLPISQVSGHDPNSPAIDYSAINYFRLFIVGGSATAGANIMLDNIVFTAPKITNILAAPADINVVKGTAIGSVTLPTTVTVQLSDSTTASVPVTWDKSSYDANTVGKYTFPGTLDLTELAIENPDNVSTSVKVNVVQTVTPPILYDAPTQANILGWHPQMGTVVYDANYGAKWTFSDAISRIRYDFEPIDTTPYKFVEIDMYIGSDEVANSINTLGFTFLSGDTAYDPAADPSLDHYWDGVNWLSKDRNRAYVKGWNHIVVAIPSAADQDNAGAPAPVVNWDPTKFRSIILTPQNGDGTKKFAADSMISFKNITLTKEHVKPVDKGLNPNKNIEYTPFLDCDTLTGWTLNGVVAGLTLTDDHTEGLKAIAYSVKTSSEQNSGGATIEAVLTKPVDASKSKYLEFDFWVDDPAIFLKFDLVGLDISSSGGCAKDDTQWFNQAGGYFENMVLKKGWNHMKLPFAAGNNNPNGTGNDTGKTDFSKINYFRLFMVNNRGEVDANVKIDNIIFTTGRINPKTGDNGFGIAFMMAVMGLSVLVIGSSKIMRKTIRTK